MGLVEEFERAVKKLSGQSVLFAFILLLFLTYAIISHIKAELAPAMDDLRLALSLIMFAWILNWMRKLLGSVRLAILFAVVISYLIFFKHPNILFTLFGLLFFAYFFKPFWSKATDKGAPPYKDIMDYYKELAEKGSLPPGITPWPYYYPPPNYLPQMPIHYEKKGDEKK